MTIVTISRQMWIPGVRHNQAVPTEQGFLLNASGEKFAMVFQSPKTITIDVAEYKLGAVTTGDNLKTTLQTVNAANGEPTGTAVAGSSSSVDASGSSTDAWHKTATTVLNADLVKGTWYALVVEFDSYVAGNLEIDSASSATPNSQPYVSHQTSGSWVHASRAPNFILKDDAGAYHGVSGCYASQNMATTVHTWDNANNPDERGIKFEIPAPSRLWGVAVLAQHNSPTDFNIHVYKTTGTTPQETVFVDADIAGTLTASLKFIPFLSTYDMAADESWRITCVPVSATNTMRMGALQHDSAAICTAFNDDNVFIYTNRDGGSGAFTDVDTDVFGGLYPILDGFDNGAGGGGGAGGGALINAGLVN